MWYLNVKALIVSSYEPPRGYVAVRCGSSQKFFVSYRYFIFTIGRSRRSASLSARWQTRGKSLLASAPSFKQPRSTSGRYEEIKKIYLGLMRSNMFVIYKCDIERWLSGWVRAVVGWPVIWFLLEHLILWQSLGYIRAKCLYSKERVLLHVLVINLRLAKGN